MLLVMLFCQNQGMLSESVLLHLLRTKCLPILLYSLGAMQLSSKNVRDLSMAWNDAYRRSISLCSMGVDVFLLKSPLLSMSLWVTIVQFCWNKWSLITVVLNILLLCISAIHRFILALKQLFCVNLLKW